MFVRRHKTIEIAYYGDSIETTTEFCSINSKRCGFFDSEPLWFHRNDSKPFQLIGNGFYTLK